VLKINYRRHWDASILFFFPEKFFYINEVMHLDRTGRPMYVWKLHAGGFEEGFNWLKVFCPRVKTVVFSENLEQYH